ncbi:hypothetical protein OROGR_021601 [Orobanche gracilis]
MYLQLQPNRPASAYKVSPLPNLKRKRETDPLPISPNIHRKMYLKALVLYLLTWMNATAAYQPRNIIEAMQANTSGGNRSSIVFQIVGNVYPLGYYKVPIRIGDSPEPYLLDMDTGSDLTWLQCDTPCHHCSKGPNGTLYKHKGNPVICAEPVCDRSLQRPESPCQGPDEQCDYEVAYTNHGASIGVLVRDSVHLDMTDGAVVAPQLAFGCGYNKKFHKLNHLNFIVDGVLGLGRGKSSILTQLASMNVTQNIVAHCLNGQQQGGGNLFLGHYFDPNSNAEIVQTSILSQSNHYYLGWAKLQYGNRQDTINIEVSFDSGRTHTYLNSVVYNNLLSNIKEDLKGKQVNVTAGSNRLPMCWKGGATVTVISYFKPLVLNFFNNNNTEFKMDPESYLITKKKGNVCLGIMDGGKVGLNNILPPVHNIRKSWSTKVNVFG